MNDVIQNSLNEAFIILSSLHFVRADWFYAFIPLFLYLLLSYKKNTSNTNWLDVIDSRLLPYVLSRTGSKQRRYPLFLIFIASSLCITALAGPVYKKLPQPVYREQSSLIVLLDLSQSMNATDIKPSRLSRAKLELLDLLKTRKTGQTALIVYAANAFVVTPLTDDNATIANLVPSLETDMMPTQGSSLSTALAKAFNLFTQSGIIKGDILVITDGIHQGDEDAIKKVSSQGHRLSIFGMGTTAGAPIPLQDSVDGGFLKDSSGAIVIPKLQPARLQHYALSGGGLYTSLLADDSDVNKLARLFESKNISQDNARDKQTNDLNADIWQEEGYWLLLPLLFFAALWARKGWIAVLLPFVILFIAPQSQPAYAGTIDTQHLWSSPDQKAMKAFNAGDNTKAATQFTQPEWKASAYYRSGDFEAAARTLKNTKSSDGNYNKGNALAKIGEYDEAIKAYDKAIELDENNSDAIYNREQVKNVLQQQQEKQQGEDENQDSNSEESSDQKQDDQKQSDKQDSQQDNGESQDQQQNESEEQEDNKNQQPSPGSEQQKQAEQEELKQRDAESEAKQQQQEQKEYEESQKEQQSKNEEENKDKDKEVENTESEEKPAEIEINPMEASITEDEKATEQWLKRIPDDPGGLLRRKFYYQYKQIPNQSDTDEPW